MIVDYFKYSLFTQVTRLHIGYTEKDISVSTIDDFTDYEVVTDITYRDTEQIFFKLTNPKSEKYNIVVGYSSSGGLVFIKGIILDISEYAVESVQFNVIKVSSGEKVTFDITQELTYVDHVHEHLNLNVKSVNKFTNYINELINDELQFCKGKLIKRAWFPSLTANVCKVGFNGSAIDSQVGVYGVNFKYEMMPREILSLLDEELASSPDRINFTYRGEVICYKKSSSEYHIIRDGVDQVFNFPITLITENYAVRSNSIIYQWQGVTKGWVALVEKCNLVIYRAAFKLDNGQIYRLI